LPPTPFVIAPLASTAKHRHQLHGSAHASNYPVLCTRILPTAPRLGSVPAYVSHITAPGLRARPKTVLRKPAPCSASGAAQSASSPRPMFPEQSTTYMYSKLAVPSSSRALGATVAPCPWTANNQ